MSKRNLMIDLEKFQRGEREKYGPLEEGRVLKGRGKGREGQRP